MSDSKRKLAAVVFTDIVGFTKLTAENQSKASALIKKQRELFLPIVNGYSGTWVKEIGDGLLLTFDTVTDAVNCCIKLQKVSKDIENLNIRIGIHQGEILVEGDDVLGDDVNIAARIEPFAAPGGIAISNKVNDAIIREEEYETKYIGKPKLKGVGQKVEIYCITSHGLPETKISNVSAKLESDRIKWNYYSISGVILTIVGCLFWVNVSFLGIGIAKETEVPSIAILPFSNKGILEDDFYAYGISADLVSELASAGLVRVASLANIEKIENYENLQAEELASKLFVRYIVEGTLWKKDKIFQLSIELFDTKENKIIWTERWQEDWKELSQIKINLANGLLKNFENVNQNQRELKTINPNAYELFLKARYKIRNQKNSGDEEIAIELFKKAVEVDSSFLNAKIYLGKIYLKAGNHNTWEKANNVFLKVLDEARLSGDKSAEAGSLYGMANVLWYKSYNNKLLLDEASGILRKVDSIYDELNNITGQVQINLFRSGIYSRKGEYAKAIELTNKGLDISEQLDDKRSIASCLSQLSDLYLEIDDFDNGEKLLNKTLKIQKILDNKFSLSHTYNKFGSLYYSMGKYDDALDFENKQLKICKEIGNVHRTGRVYDKIGIIHYTTGNYEKAYDFQKKSMLSRQKTNDENGLLENYYRMSSIQYALGNFDKALEYIFKSGEIQKIDGTTKYWKLHTFVLKNLILKKQGKTLQIDELNALYEKNNWHSYMSLSGELEYGLYEITNDSNYLKIAYEEVIKDSEHFDNSLKEIFYGYPNQRNILNQYNNIFKEVG